MFSQNVYVLGFLFSIIAFFNIKELFKAKEKREKITKNQIIKSSVIGLFGLGTIAFQSLSIELLGPFFTAIALAVSPVLILLLAILTKEEKLKLIKLLGIVITIAGVVVSVALT